MKPSELDKANGKHVDEWVPEVGVVCELWTSVSQERHVAKFKFAALVDGWIYGVTNGYGSAYCAESFHVRPLKSKAEKLRDEQIGAMFDTNYRCHKLNEFEANELARQQYDAGCRMTRELTDEALQEIWERKPSHEWTTAGYAKACAAFVRGELEI